MNDKYVSSDISYFMFPWKINSVSPFLMLQVLLAELLKCPREEGRRRLVEHVLSTTADLRSSTWEQQLRTASAQMAGAEGTAVSEVGLNRSLSNSCMSLSFNAHQEIDQCFAKTGIRVEVLSSCCFSLLASTSISF